MSVRCSKCGEELMGAVNRCWRCGSTFDALPVESGLPPVRRAPIADVHAANERQEPLEAELMPEEVLAGEEAPQADATAGVASDIELQDTGEVAEAPIDAQPVRTAQSTGAAGGQPAVHRGSPFAGGDSADAAIQRQVLAAYYPKHTAATGGAIAAFVLGLLSLISSCFVRNIGTLFALGPVTLALAGVGMGAWGMYSERRGVAVAGLVFCCFALMVAGFLGAIGLFEDINGYGPFDSLPVEDEVDPFSDGL